MYLSVKTLVFKSGISPVFCPVLAAFHSDAMDFAVYQQCAVNNQAALAQLLGKLLAWIEGVSTGRWFYGLFSLPPWWLQLFGQRR